MAGRRTTAVLAAITGSFALTFLCVGCGQSTSNTARSVTTSTTVTTRPTVSTAVPTPTSAPTARGSSFTVSPTELTVGKPVTFSGTGCPSGDVVLVGTPGGVGYGGGTTAEIRPRPDGSWGATVTVTDWTLLGARSAGAACAKNEDHAYIFQYPPVGVQVSTFRHLYVTPHASVRPGTTLTITQAGGCTTENRYARAAVSLETDRSFLTGAGSASQHTWASVGFAFDAHGNWSGTLVVPADMRTGSYFVNASCDGPSRSMGNAIYPSVPITVG